MENNRIIVLVGFPGSGKSTYCKRLEHRDFVRISQDEHGKMGHMVVFNEALENKSNIIIDRCGFNKEQRQRYLKRAKEVGYNTTIIWLTTPAEECINRIKSREDHPNLGKDKNFDRIESIVRSFEKDFVAPTEDEADEVIKI